MDQLANGMGELCIEQEATLDVIRQKAQHIQALQEEQNRQWAGWLEFYPPPHVDSEQKASLGRFPPPLRPCLDAHVVISIHMC